MARPIRNTPILFGKDAEQFFREIAVLPSESERRKERERIEASVQRLALMMQRAKETEA